MQIYTTYKVKIKHYNHIFKETVAVYRNAVDYLIDVCNVNWDNVNVLKDNVDLQGKCNTTVAITLTED